MESTISVRVRIPPARRKASICEREFRTRCALASSNLERTPIALHRGRVRLTERVPGSVEIDGGRLGEKEALVVIRQLRLEIAVVLLVVTRAEVAEVAGPVGVGLRLITSGEGVGHCSAIIA